MSDTLEPLDPAVRELVEAEKARPEPPTGLADGIMNRVATTLIFAPSAAAKAMSTDGSGRPEISPDPTSALPPVRASGGGLHASARFLRAQGTRAALIFLGGITAGAVGHGVIERVIGRAPPSGVASPVAWPVAPTPPLEAHSPPGGAVAEPPAQPPAESAPLSRRPARPPSVPVPSPSLESGGKLAAERKLIEIARTALGRGRYDEALKSLGRHATQFSDGELEEEREGLMVLALIGHGDRAEARARGERFLQRFPHSLFAQPIEAALRSIP